MEKQSSTLFWDNIVLELPVLKIRAFPPVAVQGCSTLSSSSATVVAQWCLCPAARLWCVHPETCFWQHEPPPWSEFKPPASKICFSLLSAIDLLEVVCSSSGPVGHRLKITDLDRYLNKSGLLTLLGFIFLQCGYLALPYSRHIICSSNMVNKCPWEVYFLASDFQWRRQRLEFSLKVITKYEND